MTPIELRNYRKIEFYSRFRWREKYSLKTFCTVIGMLGRLYKEDGTRKRNPRGFRKTNQGTLSIVYEKRNRSSSNDRLFASLLFGTDYKTVIQRVLRMDLTEFETRPTGLYLLTVFLFVGISGCSGIQNEP